jgi:hypothetical protein
VYNRRGRLDSNGLFIALNDAALKSQQQTFKSLQLVWTNETKAKELPRTLLSLLSSFSFVYSRHYYLKNSQVTLFRVRVLVLFLF